MTEPLSAEEPQGQRARSRLEVPILEVVAAEARVYPVTTAVIAICIVNFLAVNLLERRAATSVLEALAPNSLELWSGALWGLATSAFVHVAWWHILFNVWWTRDFGRLVEPDLGRGRYVGFVLASAIVGSGWQLLITNATGIGLSGVVYALFGYTLARRGSRPTFQAFLRRGTIVWLLGWLVFCIVMTLTNVWSVGNAAHIAGLAAGSLVGLALERPRLRLVSALGLGVLLLGVVASCTYMPWSAMWQARAVLRQIATWHRQAEAGDVQAQAMYGSALMQFPSERQQGIEWLRRAAQAGNPSGMNGLAWWLATAPESGLRNGQEAVQWAEKAYQIRRSALAADTLAAAFAEADRWDDAVATQEMAVRDLPAAESKYAQEFKDRLDLYRRHEKWRERP